MDSQFPITIAIGLAAGGFLYVGLGRSARDPAQRKALAVASFAIGGLLSFWLLQRPDVTERFLNTIANRAMAIVAAALVAALVFWKVKGWFFS